MMEYELSPADERRLKIIYRDPSLRQQQREHYQRSIARGDGEVEATVQGNRLDVETLNGLVYELREALWRAEDALKHQRQRDAWRLITGVFLVWAAFDIFRFVFGVGQ